MRFADKDDVLGQLRASSKVLQAHGVKRIGLFGSFVRNEATLESDVDLLVEFDPSYKTLSNLVGLSRYLTDTFGRKVELVTPQSLSPFLAPHIIEQVEYVAI